MCLTGIADVAVAFKQKEVAIPVNKPKTKVTKNLLEQYPILILENLCDILGKRQTFLGNKQQFVKEKIAIS